MNGLTATPPDRAGEADKNGHEDQKMETKKPPQKKRPNYNLIHARPLPLETYPLPAFVPHNPLSILRILKVIISQFLWPPSSHPENLCRGYFSSITQAIHVTNSKDIRLLWEQGFYGKGTLSRSEPSWLDREKRRKGLLASETSEEVTQRRREERRHMKVERARKEREAIENQLRVEGKLRDSASDSLEKSVVSDDNITPTAYITTSDPHNPSSDGLETISVTDGPANNEIKPEQHPSMIDRVGSLIQPSPASLTVPRSHSLEVESNEIVEDLEYLQLAPEEAFFLNFALGTLEVIDPSSNAALSSGSLFQLLCKHSTFPPHSNPSIQPDDRFLLRYVAYHHFRSLGWVVRPGVKFSVDFLLYLRGPVFSHAEFAVLILPSYGHAYWSETPERRIDVAKKEKKEWSWLHCINRVQASVKKSLVLVYVEIPPPFDLNFSPSGDLDVTNILNQYKVREFVLRRWVANRMRK